MIIRKLSAAISCAAALISASPLYAQEQRKDTLIFPELVYTDIKGAPQLTAPALLMAGNQPVAAKGMGWASPATYDWNKDGKKDLLVGEFASGLENEGRVMGSFIRVYENEGTDAAPLFGGKYYYARPISPVEYTFAGIKDPMGRDNGTPISIATFCCQSFKPEFVDLNGDGLKDIATGHYYPGNVSWFRGHERGFLYGEKLWQAGFPETPKEKRGTDEALTDGRGYYSAVSFGDFNGDGLQDMLFSNAQHLRISNNIGTKTNPKFGPRELVKDPAGKDVLSLGNNVPTVTDWDQDGVLDVLTTGCFCGEESMAVLFYKGVKVKGAHRFEQGIPLFQAKDGSKAFPGNYLSSYVTDWNNDGVNDLLIGTNVYIQNEKPIAAMNWKHEFLKEFPAYYSDEQRQKIEKHLKKADSLEVAMGKEMMAKKLKETNEYTYYTRQQILDHEYGGSLDYQHMVHYGYVYLLLGRKK